MYVYTVLLRVMHRNAPLNDSDSQCFISSTTHCITKETINKVRTIFAYYLAYFASLFYHFSELK